MNEFKIYVVIVTYGDRKEFLYKSIDSILMQTVSVKKIVLVNNGSVLDDFQERYDLDSVQIISLDKNHGSAKAFSLGISEAVRCGSDFIWLLDDDNLVEPNSLKVLVDFDTQKLLRSEIAVSSNRVSRKKYNNIFSIGSNELIVGKRNTFFQMSFKFGKRHKKNVDDWCEVEYVTYGGFFFASSIIDKVGLPDESYVTYMDDRDFTYRFFKSNIRLFVLKDSRIIDIDDSWISTRYIGLPAYYNPNSKRMKVFYSFRNRIRFDLKYSVSNILLYRNSVLIYIWFGFLISLINGIGFGKSLRKFKLLKTVFNHEFS
jgi:GT2 family glycosyltransferase